MNPQDLAHSLMLSKEMKKGYGLAAPQVGVNLRVFAFLNEVAFNPVIMEEWGPYDNHVEGCLSYPGLWIQTKRATEIRMSYFTEKGELVERMSGSKLEAIVFQHELDHLNGVTFTDRASDLKLRRAIDQANKHGHNYTFKELHAN